MPRFTLGDLFVAVTLLGVGLAIGMAATQGSLQQLTPDAAPTDRFGTAALVLVVVVNLAGFPLLFTSWARRGVIMAGAIANMTLVGLTVWQYFTR